MDYKDFIWFIQERENIRLKKEAGHPRPWTNDLILDKTRFCNIDRIHDKGTIRLLNFVSGMYNWEKIFYITLYRSAISSEKFLERMSGVWIHDYRNLKFLDFSISDARKPYQVFLRQGDTIKGFVVGVAVGVAKRIWYSLPDWNDVSILEASEDISSFYQARYGKKMIFLATEVAKDLSYFLPQINSDSECRMNIGARMALRKLPGRSLYSKIEILLNSTSLNFSSLEHGLCEWGKYLSRKKYYEETGELKPAWIY